MQIDVPDSEAARITKEYLQAALQGEAYLHITHHVQPETDPLDVEFFWDETGFGSIAKVNLREEYLEVFKDDPTGRAAIMPGVIDALRKLANEIEAIHAEAIKS